LKSAAEADHFVSLISGINYTFDISIKLNWNAGRSTIEGLYRKIANTRNFFLEIDGVTLDACYKKPIQLIGLLAGINTDFNRIELIYASQLPSIPPADHFHRRLFAADKDAARTNVV
jgi:hypothetical protein